MKHGKYEEAITFFSKSILINNKRFYSYHQRSEAKSILGDFEGALRDLDSAIMLNKNAFFLYNNRGRLNVMLGFTAEALPDFEEAQRLTNSSNMDVLYNIAVVKYKLGDDIGALQICKEALQIEPKNEDLFALKKIIMNKFSE
jgi:tetratricopeptide (TPR) repeat protein